MVFGQTAAGTIRTEDVAAGVGRFVIDAEPGFYTDCCSSLGSEVAGGGDVDGDGLDDDDAPFTPTTPGSWYVVRGASPGYLNDGCDADLVLSNAAWDADETGAVLVVIADRGRRRARRSG